MPSKTTAPLRFLHIPKTAGSSFCTFLHRLFPDSVRFNFSGDLQVDRQNLVDQTDGDLSKIKLFSGHSPLNTGIPEVDRAKTVTFLRNPVTRTMSFCQHVFEGKSEHLLRRFPPSSFNIDHFLSSGQEELSNMQALMLIDLDVGWPDTEGVPACELVDMAIASLSTRIFAFGLQEYFEQSLALFASKLGWETPVYDSVNQGSALKPLVFEPRHIRQIIRMNLIDMEIYAEAKVLFKKALAADPRVKAILQHMRRLNGLERSVRPDLDEPAALAFESRTLFR